MKNLLESPKIKDKLKWYMRAHGHSSLGGLNLIWTYFEYSGKEDAAKAVQASIDEFETLPESKDLDKSLARLEKEVQSVRSVIVSEEVPEEKQAELLEIYKGVQENIERIKKIISEQDYCEHFSIDKVLFSTVHQVLQQYPNELYGDLIKPGEKDEGQNIELKIDEPGENVTPACCGYELQLLLYNILSNAIDAIKEVKEKGKIRLQITHTKSRVKIKVRDDGKSLTEAQVRKINSKKSFSTKGKQHGRGLKIVYDILGKCKGELQAKANKKAGEVAFSISMPVIK